MSNSNLLVQISLYLKGDGLKPDEVTSITSISPVRKHSKGDRLLSSVGNEIIRSTGLWCFSIKSEKMDFASTLSLFLPSARSCMKSLAGFNGIEEAYIDVLVLVGAEEGRAGTVEFDIDPDSLMQLRDIDLPVRFTVSVVPE